VLHIYLCFSYGQTVDSILEEEEQYADQLKEYMAFADNTSVSHYLSASEIWHD
jgi:hypothetical protein